MERRIAALARLGEFLGTIVPDFEGIYSKDFPVEWKAYMQQAVTEAGNHNPWFTRDQVNKAVRSLAIMLMKKDLQQWISAYGSSLGHEKSRSRIGIVMAGNIPMVGFHDLLCVLVSGHKAIIKLSSKDAVLIPALWEILCRIEPLFRSQAEIAGGKLDHPDAVIATGSNNTFRYFEYYFRHIPRLLRKNRNSVAVLQGNETARDLEGLADDVFQYFGMGCRSVSKVFVPRNYDMKGLFGAFAKYSSLAEHHKYFNNYEYYKSIYLVNGDPHLDNGFVILKPEPRSYSSPVSVLFTEEYENPEVLKNQLSHDKEEIQCVVARRDFMENVIAFGHTQQPRLWDYADGADVMEFLVQV